MALTLEEIRSYIPELRDKPVNEIIAVMEQNGFDTSAIAQEETAQPEESGLLRSYVGIPLLKGVSGVGSAVGYGLEASGIAPETGRAIQESGDELNRTLTERQSKQAQEDAQKKLIDENGNYGGYNAGTFVQQATESLPAMAAMALPGGLLTKALTPIAGGLVGSSIGFGASEGAFSGAQNASQIQQEIRSADFETLLQHPEFKRTVEQETSPELSMDDRLMIARDIVARKAGDQVFADTFVKTGGISSVTGGGMLGALGRGGYTGGLATRMAKGFGNEGILQEAPQSALEQQTINQAKKDYLNPNQDTNEGVLTSGLEGGLVGGVLGAAGGFKANVEDIAKAPTVDDAIKAASDAVEGGPTWTKPEAKDIKNPWTQPEFKDIPDAEKIVQNRTLPGAPLQDFIDSQYQPSGYTPSEQVWERPNIEQVQGQADKNRAFYEAEQAAIQQKQDDLAAMERNPDASPAQVKQYRKKRIELQLQKRKNADLFRQGLGFSIVPMQAGEVKNDQLSTQLTRALNEQKVAEATGGGTGGSLRGPGEGKRIPRIVTRKRRLENPDNGTVGLPDRLPERDQRTVEPDLPSAASGVGSLDTPIQPQQNDTPQTNQGSPAPQPAAQDANLPAARTPAPSVPEAKAEPVGATTPAISKAIKQPTKNQRRSVDDINKQLQDAKEKEKIGKITNEILGDIRYKNNYEKNKKERGAFVEKHHIPFAYSIGNLDYEKAADDVYRGRVSTEKAQEILDDAKASNSFKSYVVIIDKIQKAINTKRNEQSQPPKNEAPQKESGPQSAILTVSKKRYLSDQKRAYNKANPNAIKSAKDKAYADIERNYEDELLKAEVSLPFEQYRQRNPDLTENLARQTYDQVREELGLNEKRTADLPVQETPLDEQAVVQSEKVLPAGAGTEKVPEANTEATEIKASDDKSESQLNKPKPKQSAINDKDDLLAAIAKLGGLKRDEAKAQGIDPASFNKRGYGIMRVFTKGGKSYDEMAELLRGYYFDAPTANDLVDQVSRAINQGEKIYTPVGYEIKAELMEQERLSDEEARRVINYQSLLETAKQHDADFGTNYLDILLAKEDMDYDDINAWEEDFYNDRQERIKESLADSETALSSYTEQDIKDREQAGQQREKQAQSDRVKAEADKEFDSVFDELAGTAPKTQDVFGMSDPLEKVSEPEEKEEVAPRFRKEDIPYDIAYRAYAGISFDPEKRAKSTQEEYVNYMQSVYDDVIKIAKNNEQRAVIDAAFDNYRRGYIQKQLAHLQAKSRVLSPMIAGPANFPVRRNEKANNTEHKRLEEFIEWDKKARDRLKEIALGTRSQEEIQDDRFRTIKNKLESSLSTIKGIDNGTVRGSSRPLFVSSITGTIKTLARNGQSDLVNKALDYIADYQKDLKKPLITPQNAIWTLRNQIAENQEPVAKPSGTELIKAYQGAKIVNNHDAERVQILFDEKPSEEIRTALKKEAFKWSPSNSAWQRQNTPNGIAAAKRVLDSLFSEKPEAAKKSQTQRKGGLTKVQVLAHIAKKYRKLKPLVENGTVIVYDTFEDVPAEIRGEGMASKSMPDKITIDGIERWTVNSNGQPIAQTEEGIRNFWQWFGDSKVVDDQGRPLVVYHSALDDKTQFDKHGKFMGYTGVSGISLTDSKEMASRYLDRFGQYRYDGKPFEKNILALYARAENPLYRNEPFKSGVVLGAPLPDGYISPVEKMGHDALIRNDAISRGGGVKHSTAKNAIRGREIVVFSPNQIKSAIGNTGAFDPNNNDIRYSTPGKSQNPVKIEGFTYKGKIYLIADALSPETIDGVIHHEFFHKVIADNPKIRNRLLGAQSDLRGIMRQVEAGRYRGRYKEIYDAAMDRAKKAGTASEQEKLEEFLAYSVSKYLDNPQSLPERLARIIKDIIAAIKLAVFKLTGKITDISPADLTAMARSSMRVSEDGGGGMKSSKLALPDKITIDGIERWTVNSNGQPIAQTEEGIKNFWKWFSGSHATDKQGRPLVVFHGSNQEQLNEFDTSAVGDEYNQDSRGFFFTDDKEEAESYARNTSYGLPRETKGAVVSAYLKLKSPLIKNIDFDPISEWDDNHESFQKEAFGKNADGIIIKAQKYQSMYVAFEPTQIKSIDNSGAFDPANPDIRYSLAEDTTREELNRRIREQHKTVSDRAKQWFTREFHPGGALPKAVFTLKVARDSEINAEELIAHNLVAMLDKSVKAAWGGRMTEEQKQLVGARLKGEEVSLPASVKDSIDAMRLHIDKLSARYADILFKEAEELQAADKTEAAAAKVQLLNTIANNIGSYVNRSYRAFDNENWAKQVPDDVLNNARDYLEERFRSKGSVTPIADAQRTINDILKTGTAYDTFEQYIRESKLGAKDLSVLIKRKDIAPEIRALLGEYTDPRINFVKSATKMSRLIFNDDFLKQVKTTGLGADGFLFTKDNRPADEHTVKIAADSSSPMAPLNGLYTYPEINQAFVDALNKESMESWYRMIVQANGLVKYGKTVLSPTTSFRNWMSAYFFTLANGHFDLSHMKESIESFKTYFDQDNGRLHYLEKLKRLGVIYDTPYAGEMMALLADSKFESALMGEDGRFSKAKLKVKDWMDLATKFYQFGDDFWKIIGFENEKQILKKYRGLTDAQAEVEAAKRIRNTYPTYSMVGRMIQKLRRFPLVGTFVSFPAEIIRTSFNILKYAKEDMAYSKELGMRRIAGIAMVSGFAYAAQALAMSLTGTDDHDEEALRDLAPPWSKNSNIIPMGRDKNGSLIYIDMSFLDPYNYFKRPLNAILRGQPIDETAYEIGREILTPFFGQDIAFGAISDIWQNKKDSGGQVFNPNDSALNIGVDIANHLRKNLQPGIVSNMERMTYALTGHKSTSGQTNTVAEELAALAGFRVSRVNPKVALYYRSYEFQDKLKDASKILNDVARDPNRVSDSRLKSAYERAIETRSEAFKDMHELVSSAENAGLSKAAIRKLLKLNHVSQKNINFILLGKEPKWVPSETFLKSSIAKSDELFDAETTKEFERRRKLILSGKE